MRSMWLLLVLVLVVACGPSSGAGGTDASPGGGNGECGNGFADCDGDPSNGCETDLSTIDNCGQCGNTCGAANGTPSCSGGTCTVTCNAGWGNCDYNAANGCEQSLDSALHCGSCNNACTGPQASGTCVQGMCELSCNAGYGDCNADFTDGCESKLDTVQACGACDNGCAGECGGNACVACDDGVALDSTDPFDAAKAMGLCADVINARWALPDGSEPPANANFALGHGNLTNFGPNVGPRQGSKLLSLSSGTARAPGNAGYQSPGGFNKGYTANHPHGFPKESPACPNVTTGAPRDAIALELELQVPDWAQGLAFDFKFYTYEWPSFICSQYNDFFVAILEPFPEGQTDGNISFDSMGNPISVNNAFMTACGCLFGPPCLAGGKTFQCPDGTSTLMGTGFDSSAATSWLTTSAPVEPGSVIKLRLGVYDSGDNVLDSTTLIDNFRWLPTPPDVETTPID